jgi:hypothetical protein
MFPDQSNCQQFWFCNTQLIPYVYTCAAGQYFDADLLACNPIASVDCGSRPTPTPTGGTGDTTVSAIPTPSSTQGCDYVSELLPNCNDCGSFFECDALLNPVYFKCPDGEYFSISANDCQDSDNVNCVDGTRPDYDLCP